MNQSFNFHTDRRTKVLTTLTFIIFVVGAAALFLLYKGGFFSAWFISLVLALSALMILSIPRRIAILEETLEIQCISDTTEIDVREIASIKKVEKREMRWMMPLFASSGFFGYYGKFFDFRELETVTIYASEWNNFVEITDIYDTRVYVSCRDADKLIQTITQAQNELAISSKE